MILRQDCSGLYPGESAFHQYNLSVEERRDQFLLGLIILIVVALTTLPYVMAFQAGGRDYVFGGFLLNPLDGHSYLSKMYLGWQGSWEFRLPFTSQDGSGSYLFLFYIFLGHLVRWSGLSFLAIFHLTRIFGTVFMLLALFKFLQRSLPLKQELWFAFILASFGAGMGWLTIPFGGFTADFWVAEAYPFLSAYANPHFPISLGLLFLILTPPGESRYYQFHFIVLGLFLAVILPFGVVIAVIVLTGTLILFIWRKQPYQWIAGRLFWVALGGIPVLIYDFWLTKSDPLLAVWNAQNQTPSPGIGDLVLSFSPAVLLAVLGGWVAITQRRWILAHILLWSILVLGLIYLPVNLQRRLLLGYYVPLAALAAPGLSRLTSGVSKRFRLVGIVVLLLAIPTNLLILTAAAHGARTLDPALYRSRSEEAGLHWIRENTPADSLILASPEMGLFIPSQTGQRVIYGHPFETVEASQEELVVESFFQGALSLEEQGELLTSRGVDYIFMGPRERALGEPEVLAAMEIVFAAEDVVIYRLSDITDGQ